jgi:hypothetical protein
MDDVVRLVGRKPVAWGGRQLVFEHPGNPSLVIKVLQRDVIPGDQATLWFRLAARYYYSISFVRVWREFERFRRRGGGDLLQRVIGMVDTDLGPGLVAKAERGSDGGYAPTLSKLARCGEIDGAAFDRFCSEVDSADIVVSDLNPGNVVYAVDSEGGTRFVLVDGTADDTLIPILRMSKALNRIIKKRKIAVLRRKIDRIRTLVAGAGPEQVAGMDPVSLADGVGFEPTVGFHPRRFSRPVP